MSIVIKDLERTIRPDLIHYFGEKLVENNMDGDEDILVEFVTLGREELMPLELEKLKDLTETTYYTGVGIIYDNKNNTEFMISTIHTDDEENKLLALVELYDDEVTLIKRYY